MKLVADGSARVFFRGVADGSTSMFASYHVLLGQFRCLRDIVDGSGQVSCLCGESATRVRLCQPSLGVVALPGDDWMQGCAQ